jgi:hypothetical protein
MIAGIFLITEPFNWKEMEKRRADRRMRGQSRAVVRRNLLNKQLQCGFCLRETQAPVQRLDGFRVPVTEGGKMPPPQFRANLLCPAISRAMCAVERRADLIA